MAPTSRIDFTPEQTTVMGVTDRVVRSADSSQLSRACRCTPPRPPVANTRMPASQARWLVAATVVAPQPPRLTSVATSRTLTLTTSSRLATWSRASSSRPIRTRPSRMAIVAGTAPRERTMSSTSVATRRFSGRGSPWLMMVDSRATTAAPAASASAHLLGDLDEARDRGAAGCRCAPVRWSSRPRPYPRRHPRRSRRGRLAGRSADQNGVRVGPGLPARPGRPMSCCATAIPSTCVPSPRATGTPCGPSTPDCPPARSTSASSPPSRS